MLGIEVAQSNRGEVHDQEAGATFPGLEDISAQSYRWDRFNRPVCGSYGLLQAALWPGYSSSRPQATSEHQRDAQSDHRVDRRSGDPWDEAPRHLIRVMTPSAQHTPAAFGQWKSAITRVASA